MTYPPDPKEPDLNYQPIQLELDIQATPPSALAAPRAARTRKRWHQDPLVRTWLFPSVIGAGLGMLYTFGLFWLLVVLGLLADNKLNLTELQYMPNALYVYGKAGACLGMGASVLLHLKRYPDGNLVKVLKGAWQVLVVLCKGMVVLMSVLIPSLAVGAVVAQTTNKRR